MAHNSSARSSSVKQNNSIRSRWKKKSAVCKGTNVTINSSSARASCSSMPYSPVSPRIKQSGCLPSGCPRPGLAISMKPICSSYSIVLSGPVSSLYMILKSPGQGMAGCMGRVQYIYICMYSPLKEVHISEKMQDWSRDAVALVTKDAK